MQQQPPQRLAPGDQHLAQGGPGLAREVEHARPNVDRHHQHDAQHDARDDARHEELAHRRLGRRAVDDHHDGGRDQDAEGAGVADHSRGHFLGISGAHHAADHDRAHRDHRGRRRARHRREEHAREDRGHREPATQVADARVCEADHALCHSARGHERAGEDEEGDREQRELLRGLEELERERGEGIAAHEHDGEHRAQAERDGDRDAEQHEQEQHREQHRGDHRAPPPSRSSLPANSSFCRSASAASSPRCRWVSRPDRMR